MPLQNVEQAFLCIETTIVRQDVQLPVKVAEVPEQYPLMMPSPPAIRAR